MFLEIEKINKYYGEGENRNHVLKDVTTGVEKGKICVLLGPSGSGKSTLLNIIGGIDEADGGNIIIDGAKLEDMKEKQLSLYRRKHLGYVFQMYNLIPNLTVRACYTLYGTADDNYVYRCDYRQYTWIYDI